MDDKVESGKVFRPSCLYMLMHEDFSHGEVLEIPVVGANISRVTGTFKIVLPSFKSFVVCR